MEALAASAGISFRVDMIFIEHFPSGGFDNTSYPPAGFLPL
jgi:hypothetical protein